MSHRTTLFLGMLLMSLALPARAGDANPVTTQPFTPVDTEVAGARGGGEEDAQAPLVLGNAPAGEEIQGGMDCFYLENAGHSDCAGVKPAER